MQRLQASLQFPSVRCVPQSFRSSALKRGAVAGHSLLYNGFLRRMCCQCLGPAIRQVRNLDSTGITTKIFFLLTSPTPRPLFQNNKLFGSAVKNGPLPPFGTELEVFAHNCSVPPCQITQIHVPSIYPHASCPNDWEHGRLRVYVDGAAAPTLDVRLLQLAFVGAAAEYEPQAKSSTLFSAGGLFGKNAATGGVFSTVRIPFGAGVRVTLEQAESCATAEGTYWIIVRGVEALPLRVSELDLPDAARLTVARIDNRTLQKLDFATLAAADASQDGLLFATYFEARSADPNYLEGCFRLFGPDPNASAPLFLSSGTEDYFLSASYFDEGIFAGAGSGLTYSATYPISGALSAYKTHDRDLVPFHGGFTFEWRNMETALCPTHELPQTARARRGEGKGRGDGAGAGAGPMTLSTLVYFYSWPSSATVGV